MPELTLLIPISLTLSREFNMTIKNPTFPAIPFINDENYLLFSNPNTELKRKEPKRIGISVTTEKLVYEGKTAPINFGTTFNLITLSQVDEFLDAGHQDETDSLLPEVVISNVYIAHSHALTGFENQILKGVLEGECVFKVINTHPHDLEATPRYKVKFNIGDEVEELVFEIKLKIRMIVDQGYVTVRAEDGFTIVAQSPWCVRNEPLKLSKPVAFTIIGKRINYNKRIG